MKQKKFVSCLVVLAMLAMCFVACTPASDEMSEEPVAVSVNLAEVLAPQRSQLLESGKTLQLNLPEDAEVTVASSDEKVVTVNENGLVTAVGKGLAFVTVSDSDESVRCGFLVDGEGEMIDVTKLSVKEVFSDLELHAATQITGMAVDAENRAVYLAQTYGSSSYVPLNSEIMISKVEQKGDAWELAGWMRFSGSGKGAICMDNDGQTPRLWMECSGDYIGYGKALSLMEWSDEGYCTDSYGQVFNPQGISSGMTLTADPENNMVLVYDRAEKCYRVYNRADMLAGEKTPEYVHTFACKANQTPMAGEDDSQGRYNASVCGYALYDGYLYQFSGNTSIYLSVFDLNGNLQYCHRLTDLPEKDYNVPASVSVADGKVYVVTATGNSDYNLANVWVFE